MSSSTPIRHVVVALIAMAVAFLWAPAQATRAATEGRAEQSAQGPHAAAPAATPAPAATTSATDTAQAVGGAGSTQKATGAHGAQVRFGTACTVNGKAFDPCPPALLKQVKRQAARRAAARQKSGVTAKFGGISASTSTLSPLAKVGAGPTSLAVMAPGALPDYFGVGNYANSPLPQLDATGAVIPGTGMRKFVDTLPGLCGISPWTTSPGGVTGANDLEQCIPLATKDTSVTFPNDPAGGSDFYRIGLGEFNLQMHADLPPTKIRGYYDLLNPTPFQYLGPMIVATRNRPVRLLFQNNLTPGGHLSVPVDTTYMGAGPIDNGLHAEAASDQRAVVHLHGGNTPWISDGTPHQWITPAGDPVWQDIGFAKGFSAQNVPGMWDAIFPAGPAPSVNDGMITLYWTNEQSGRLMFYHEHAYGTTRLGVYAGEAAAYLIADPIQESGLLAAGAPGTIQTDPATGGIIAADLTHVVPLVIQDKTFVPDNGTPGGQLAAQDPTWDVTSWGGYGALWFPHVYMPNQNPADITGANGFGRWDYGPWFWPPQNASTFVGQPYACTSIAYPGGAGLAYPPLMCPGTPLPSGTPESFMDTPVINGTAYPTMTVDPTAYRFQVLNAANDRSLNLGLYVAEPVTLSPVLTAPGSGYTAPTVTFGGCTGGSAIATIGDGVDPATGLPFTAGIVGITMTSQPSACTAPTITISDGGAGAGATASVVMSQNTDVKMVPAIPATAGRALPNCPTSQALPMAGGGQITTDFIDATTGVPLNGTGLPAGCWPLYSSAQGYTAGPFGENGGQLSWGNSDARTGGVPDPTMAGPPIIQIGAEGGVLPKLAVIPSTPVSYDYNKRSITVLNVLNHGLWVGPAERADIIVDFSQFAGKTLIVYNDAPAPVPAGDPRIDYYTNDPDQSDSGGAPSTLAGYGPNMRTIMQIVVNGTTPAPLNVATLANAIPTIFADTQDMPIVPESVYPAGHGNGPDTYIPIQATSINAWIGGPVGGLTLTNGGAGYMSVPNVAITGTGAGAAATATLSTAGVASVALTNTGGFGYTAAPAVSFSGGGGTGAAATASLGDSGVALITVTAGGSGYTTAPTVLISAPPAGGTQATATATVRANGQRNVTAVTVTNPGSGYLVAPAISFTGGGGTGAAATAALAQRVVGFTVTAPGSGYSTAPAVTVAAPPATNCGPASLCTAATAAATLQPRVVASVTLTNGGTGYTAPPTVTIDPPLSGTQATAVATAPMVPLLPKTIQELFTLDYGRMNATLGVEVPFTNFLTQTTIPYGYADPPTEIFKDGETQLWKITHNGVDTHFIHFHLFTVQVINRVGWDGAIKPPDPYELGMKDTVRMNPLEDIIVALRPFKQTLPFPVPNSHRPMDVTHPVGFQSTTGFTNIDPANNPATVTNTNINFGWEYVWHCHILGHEENDMMRAMVLAVAPGAPTATAATGGKKGTIDLTMSVAIGQNNVADPTGFTIQRATSPGGPWTTAGTVAATVAGGFASAAFTDSGLTSKATYYYQVLSSNLVGYTQLYAAPAIGYPNVSADSAPSAPVSAVAT